uniref:PSI domain-containing protein n=1 Tax=Hanusia phi TaxID=3032 RepID=A0A6T7MKB3_9CRYP
MRGVGAEAAHGRGGARAHARGGRTRALNTSAAQRGVSGHDKRREARSKVHHVGTSGIELRAGKQELCSHTVPQALVPSGLAGLCIIIDEGSAICGSQVMLEVKMAGDEGAVLFNKPLDLSQLQTCATAQEMHSTPIITNVCGYNATICVDFMRSGQNTLVVSEESLAGCPTIYIVDCFLGPTPLPPLPFQLDCFSFGNDCSKYSDCESCIKNGCGWCSAGYSNQHSCKPGNASGALCNDCGVPDCNCDWNFGMCPVPEADLEANEAKLNDTTWKLNSTSDSLNAMKSDVVNGQLELDGRQYDCLATSTLARDSSSQTAILVVLAIVTALVGGCAGIAFGKAGYWDMIFRRRADDEGPMITRDATGSYVPPDI